MRKTLIAMFFCVTGVIVAVIMWQGPRRNISCNGVDKTEVLRRIALMRQLPLNVQEYGECLVNDICAISNREEQASSMEQFAREVKELASSSLDLRLRYQELVRCRLLTEQVCEGYRRIGDHAAAIWNLRLALLARYASTTNECHTEWEKFNLYEKAERHRKSATGRLPYTGSGRGQSGWLTSIEGDLEHYLLSIAKWYYRVDSRQLSAGERKKIKLEIERTCGRRLEFVEPSS